MKEAIFIIIIIVLVALAIVIPVVREIRTTTQSLDAEWSGAEISEPIADRQSREASIQQLVSK